MCALPEVNIGPNLNPGVPEPYPTLPHLVVHVPLRVAQRLVQAEAGGALEEVVAELDGGKGAGGGVVLEDGALLRSGGAGEQGRAMCEL